MKEIQSKMANTCKNHPDREAKRRCYHCKEWICSECQIRLVHHIYCSFRCFLSHNIKRISHIIRDVPNHIKLQFRSLGPKIKVRDFIEIALLLLILVSTVMWIRNSMELSRLKNELSSEDVSPKQALDMISEEADSLVIVSPNSGSMILKNKIDIEGEAESNCIVSISSNGRLIDAQVVKARKFKFEGIVGKPGRNNFIVRAFREDGSSDILEEINLTFGRPTISYLTRDFSRGDISVPRIAFTFDGGYLNNATADILDILKHEDVKATIFLTGIFLRKYPELVKRMVAEGHEIGNHTWSHPHLTTFESNRRHFTLDTITREQLHEQLSLTEILFRKITGKEMVKFWRAPYGEHNLQIRQWAADLGYKHIGWTLGRGWEDGMDTLDWVADKNSSAYHSAEEISDKILTFGAKTKHGANGAIVLMHLGTERKDDYPHLKLPYIIDQLKKMNYEPVLISEMMQ